MNIYIVKSFGSINGYMNLKAFSKEEDAETYAELIRKQIPTESTDEFVEVEALEVQA